MITFLVYGSTESVTYGFVESKYFPILFISTPKPYVPGPGTPYLIMMFSGSVTLKMRRFSIKLKARKTLYRLP